MSGMKMDEAVSVSILMDAINRETEDADKAFFLLAEVKQDLLDHQDFEVLVDLHHLEQMHNIAIPFKVKT
jgi:hypothetical protein